jgi:hypothetical protein
VTFYTKDYGLSAMHLQAKHAGEDAEGQHPGFERWEWRYAVSHCQTLVGYWDWVKQQLDLEEAELSEDSPYNS